MNYTIEALMDAVETWLVKGDLNPDILSEDFTFTSPFWQQADRNAFIGKFLDPTEYIEKSLSNITKFDPAIKCVSKDEKYFTITLKYHTQNGCSVDEAVACEVEGGLIRRVKTIYDLARTKKAHNL